MPSHESDLNIPRYEDTFEEEVDLKAVAEGIMDLGKELGEVQGQMVYYLEELGLDYY